MAEAREPQLIVVTGRKGVGKTYTSLLVINRYIFDNPATGKKGRKVLIYDVNNEYSTVKTLNPKDIIRYTLNPFVEVRRIRPVKDNGTPMGIDEMNELLFKILSEFKGGLLLLEDINRYLIDTRTAEIIGAIATNRQRDLDIICHLQSLSAMTTRMWQNCSVVRFHFQMDDIYRYKNRIPNYEIFKIAQFLVNHKYHNGDKRFFCYVYQEESQIKGDFSEADYKLACTDYLNDNPRLVSVTQSRFGRGQEFRQKAVDFLCKDYMKYYGGRKTIQTK
jgi:hypothetical protein